VDSKAATPAVTAAAVTVTPESTSEAPVVAPVATAPVAAASITGMPKLQVFSLPVDELAEIAASSGLTWVNSDATKIAAVQAAIAAEPKQIHIPRERPAPIQIDAGPLILVETKRDLRKMELPFAAP
jgi:ribonuclease E